MDSARKVINIMNNYFIQYFWLINNEKSAYMPFAVILLNTKYTHRNPAFMAWYIFFSSLRQKGAFSKRFLSKMPKRDRIT